MADTTVEKTGQGPVSVHLARMTTAGGRVFGVATLDAPAALHALDVGMVHRLRYALLDWASDERVVGVLLQGSGNRAFCAGGNMRRIYDALKSGDGGAYAREFFAAEYALDYMVHTYPKPLLCWGHGVVMGGGLGLLAGASHRVVTPESRLAMPELHIGLFPDAGGTWFLRRMPGRCGLFLGLTGAPLGADDAVFGGLADVVVPHGSLAAVRDALAATDWTGDRDEDGALLHDVLAQHALAPAEGPMRHHYDAIQSLMAGGRLADVARRLRALSDGPPGLGADVASGAEPGPGHADADESGWLRQAADGFQRGAPSSLWLTWALWQRSAHDTLAQVLQREYRVALARCRHPDLMEGIRAVLVDKDRQPRWRPVTLDRLNTAALTASHLDSDEPLPPLLTALDTAQASTSP